MPTDHQGLKGKVALVTGSSRGIGRGIAVHLAGYGAKIAVNYLKNVDAANSVVASIKARGGDAFAIRSRNWLLAPTRKIENLRWLDGGYVA